MAEILDYQDIGKGPPLGRALEEIGRQVGQGDSKYDEPKSKVKSLCNRPRRLNFVTADVTELITTGLGGLNDELAAGFTAINGNFTWTVRWDWDPDKGEHVNLMIKGSRGTDKFAFLSQAKGATPGGQNRYLFTVDRFTKDCGWDKRTYESLPSAEKVAYRKFCARKGRQALAIRVLGVEMPEEECSHSLSQLLYQVNMSK